MTYEEMKRRRGSIEFDVQRTVSVDFLNDETFGHLGEDLDIIDTEVVAADIIMPLEPEEVDNYYNPFTEDRHQTHYRVEYPDPSEIAEFLKAGCDISKITSYLWEVE